MNNNIQLVLKSSTTEMSLNDHNAGIYLVPDMDGLVGLPEIRTTSGVNAGYDGGWTSAQNFDARSITLRGVIANTDVATVERMRKQLISLLAEGKNEQLTLDLVTEAGNAYELQVRTIACDMALQRVLTKQEFMIQLRADDPLIYDNSAGSESVIVQVQRALGGFTIDFELPLAISGGQGDSTITNAGLEKVYPVVKMYGALHNPVFVNQTTNQQIQINTDLSFAEGMWHTPSELYEGVSITIPEAPDNAPLASFRLDGETSQQTYRGKNLFNKTATISNIRLTATGTTYSETGYYTSEYIPVSALTNYTYSRASGGLDYSSICFYDSSKSFIADTRIFPIMPNTSTSKTFTTPASSAYIRFADSMSTIDSAQLELGSATAYEPYVGGTASPNPDYPQAVHTVTGENVVQICGKNLFDEATANMTVGLLTADGRTAAQSNRLRTDGYIPVYPNTTYTLNAASDTSSKTIQAYVVGYRESGSTTSIGNYPSNAWYNFPITFTTGANCKFIRISYHYTDNSDMNIGSAQNQQLELGSATAYEPYQGQSYEVNLGKNLFDKDHINNPHAWFLWDSATFQAYTAADVSVYIPAEPNTTYTASKTKGDRFSFGSSVLEPAGGVAITRAVANNNASSLTITTGPNDHYLAAFVRSINSQDSYEDVLATLQIEKGRQTSDYAPYFTPIELCKIGTYQDSIWKSGGKWYVRKECEKYTFTSSETVSYQSNFPRFMVNFSHGQNATAGVAAQAKSSHFVVGQTASTDGTFGIAASVIYLHNSAITSADGLKTWFGNNNVSVYYALATPTDTEITNEALIAQLDALLNNARTYAGVNNIFTVTPNEQGTLEIEYYTERDADKRDELIIDSRMRTVTLNGTDVYHLIAAGSEFPMLAPGENKLMLRSDIPGDNGYAEVNYKQGYLSI